MKSHPFFAVLFAAAATVVPFMTGCTLSGNNAKEIVPEMTITREPAITGEKAVTPVSLPSPDHLVLLPSPRTIRYTAGIYAPETLEPEVEIRPEAIPHAQGYVLSIEAARITITAADPAGAFYARQTLNQLARQFKGSGKLPVVHIEDWPDFPNRGVMLDVARDKVPTLETLYQMVDLFASLKYNQLQLYTEHSFAYPGHETVWENASPITPEEARTLDAYCKERFIELVPNQNSFGHMHRWLQHEAYAHLAESPGAPDLCPVNPGSIELLRSMYAALLPNFTSSQFNVGCDETYSLGKGGSKEAVAQLGKGRVYLNFLKEIYALLQEHGRTMQFWGDIILAHPELIPELPQNIIAMEWGYEATHPFAERGGKFAASGIPFYACPGTSSWNSLLGRTDNALENLKLAARNGLDNGAVGFLVTDWGDSGHWQCTPVSFVPFAWGAAVSWAYDANIGLDLARAADVHVFEDGAGVMAQAALDLGNAHAMTGCLRDNSTVYYGLLLRALQGSPSKGFLSGMSAAGIQNARNAIENALSRMEAAKMSRPDAGLIRDEFALNARMALFALRLGEERLKADCGTEQLPESVCKPLRDELSQITDEFKTVWLARNRPGGLADSLGRLEALAGMLSK
jgi:hypothetical protein